MSVNHKSELSLNCEENVHADPAAAAAAETKLSIVSPKLGFHMAVPGVIGRARGRRER